MRQDFNPYIEYGTLTKSSQKGRYSETCYNSNQLYSETTSLPYYLAFCKRPPLHRDHLHVAFSAKYCDEYHKYVHIPHDGLHVHLCKKSRSDQHF